MTNSSSALFDRAVQALDAFQIEIPSWGFANTGTRFGKFVQAAAASTIEEKFADAAEVNRLTGVTPTMALHVLWDLPNGVADVPEVKKLVTSAQGYVASAECSGGVVEALRHFRARGA